MKRLIKSIPLLLLALMAMPSCQEKIGTDKKTDPIVLSIQDAEKGPVEIEMFASAQNTRTEIQLRAEATPAPEELIYTTFGIDPGKVDEYNEAHGTSYQLAPAQACEMTKTRSMIIRYNTVSTTSEIVINSSAIPANVDYLLPVTITKVEGTDNYRIAEENNTLYVKIRLKKVADPELLDRKDWKVIYCNDETEERIYNGKPYGPASLILDGDDMTWWNYKTAGLKPGFDAIIDLGKEVWIKNIWLTPRHNTGSNAAFNRNPPKNVSFAFATSIDESAPENMNGGDWTEFENHPDLLQWKDQPSKFRDMIPLDKIYKARYIYFRYLAGWRGNADFLGVFLAEFEADGYRTDPMK